LPEDRLYRELFNARDFEYFHAQVAQTDMFIGAKKNLQRLAIDSITLERHRLELYIKKHPEFLITLKPYNCEWDAPLIVKRMCRAAELAGVGPMAAVAGAFSQIVGETLLEHSDELVIENGGDIFISTKHERKVGIYAGKSPLSNKFALRIKTNYTPISVCTSSGTLGHSLSLGKSDATVVVANDAFICDAAATAVGNKVKEEENVQEALEYALTIKGVIGCVVIIGDKIGFVGEINLGRF